METRGSGSCSPQLGLGNSDELVALVVRVRKGGGRVGDGRLDLEAEKKLVAERARDRDLGARPGVAGVRGGRMGKLCLGVEAREKVCVVVEVDDLDDGFELVLVEKGGAAEDDVELWEEEGDDPKHDGDKGDDVAEEKGGKRDDEVLLHLVVHGRGRAEKDKGVAAVKEPDLENAGHDDLDGKPAQGEDPLCLDPRVVACDGVRVEKGDKGVHDEDDGKDDDLEDDDLDQLVVFRRRGEPRGEADDERNGGRPCPGVDLDVDKLDEDLLKGADKVGGQVEPLDGLDGDVDVVVDLVEQRPVCHQVELEL